MSDFVKDAQRQSQQGLGGAMMRWGAAGLAAPDPIPLVDEILFGAVIVVGAGLYVHASLPYGSVTSYPHTQSLPVTSTTGHSQERKVKKQMSSTSRSHSYRRRKYYYGKKRRYY